MAGPMRYCSSMNIIVPIKAKIRGNWRMNIIAAKNEANIKATRKMDMLIVSFNSTSLPIFSQ